MFQFHVVQRDNKRYNPKQMPLSEQESRCIEYALQFLSTVIGGHWNIASHLDELNPLEPTPEVTVTNGETTAAIEVKRMAGDSAQQTYWQSLLSNEKYLVPSCGGYYWLAPPIDLRLPIDISLRRQVKREIERVAPTLKPEEEGVLRIPRNGHISLISEHNPPAIFCLHAGGFDLLQPLLERLEGRYMLVDKGLEHSFFTDEGKEAFCNTITSACNRRLKGDSSSFSWNEEWQITRLKDGGEGEDAKDGVWIITCSGARNVPVSVKENLDNVLDNALRKFIRRWAHLHILVLEESGNIHTQLIQEIVARLSPAELPNIDYVLLVANSVIIQCYPQPG